MKQQPTGNGRRESFAHPTLPRMTNTYMLPGPHAPEEIIRSGQRGLYAVNFGGGRHHFGQVRVLGQRAYLIEDGRITAPVRGATLIGNGPDVLTRVSMVGNDLKLDDGIGSCGKDGQTVPVGVGQPTLRIDALTVGARPEVRRMRLSRPVYESLPYACAGRLWRAGASFLWRAPRLVGPAGRVRRDSGRRRTRAGAEAT